MTGTMPPLFLTPDAHREALRLHEAFRRADRTSIQRAVTAARHHLAGQSWSDYDATNLALYAISLRGGGWPIALDDTPDRGAGWETLSLHLSMPLTGTVNGMGLLDERAVAMLINFRQSLQGILPFEIRPRSVCIGLAPSGGVTVSFDVRLQGLSSLGFDEDGPGTAFLAALLSGTTWKAVTERFGVTHADVSGIPLPSIHG